MKNKSFAHEKDERKNAFDVTTIFAFFSFISCISWANDLFYLVIEGLVKFKV